MSIRKSHMTVDGQHVHLSMPFAKVDKDNRLVSGFATLDNIDTQGDVVLAEASRNAFARARGNIREMHQPIAVGKMVDFREEEFFHDGEFYRGIFVTAHVSKGAEDTWEKVLDGTLTGFSIGGEINEASNQFVKDANDGKGGNVRFIKDYDLVELSLVDNPANQLANVLSIQKSATGDVTVKMGAVVDTVVENVFICSNDETVVVKGSDTEDCPMCGTKMENAGWLESGDGRTEKVNDIVTKFLNPAVEEVAPTEEGGVEMSKSNEAAKEKETSVPNPSETHPDGTPIETEAEATVEAEEEKAAEVDETEGTEEEASESPEEVHDDEDEISKKIDALHTAVKETLDANKEETLTKVAELEAKITEVGQDFLTKASELESKINEFGTKVEAQKSRLAELESSLNKMNSSEAIRKSAGVVPTQAENNVQKETFWGGAFSDL